MSWRITGQILDPATGETVNGVITALLDRTPARTSTGGVIERKATSIPVVEGDIIDTPLNSVPGAVWTFVLPLGQRSVRMVDPGDGASIDIGGNLPVGTPISESEAVLLRREWASLREQTNEAVDTITSSVDAATQAASTIADVVELKPKINQSITDAATAKTAAADAATKVDQAVTSQDSATAQNVQTGPLTKAALDKRGVAAFKVSDAGLFVSPAGSDQNDGLSPGAARLSLGAVVGSVPAGGGVVNMLGGEHQVYAPLPIKNGLVMRGMGAEATTIKVMAGKLVDCGESDAFENLTFESLSIYTYAGHIFDLGTSTGSIANSTFRHVGLISSNPQASVFNGSGTVQFLGNKIERCSFGRSAVCEVPAVNLISSGGSLNSNDFDTVTLYGNMNAKAPAIFIDATLGSYAHDNSFANIIGEQNLAGVLKVDSPNGLTLDHITDWDANGNPYVDHLVEVGTSNSPGGKAPLRVRANVVGTRYGTFASGKVAFYLRGIPGDVVLADGVGDIDPDVAAVSDIQGVSIRDASGATGTFVTKSASYDVSAELDGTVEFTGSNALTAYLPNGWTPYTGRKYTIVNSTSQPLDITTRDGFPIMGQTHFSLPSQQCVTLMNASGRYVKVA